jgi:hypothetical protein
MVSACLLPPIPLDSMWWMSTAVAPHTSQGIQSVVLVAHLLQVDLCVVLHSKMRSSFILSIVNFFIEWYNDSAISATWLGFSFSLLIAPAHS